MAIIIKTNNPNWILEQIHLRIDDSVIDTWSYDDDGDFTHIGQWANKAWFSPVIEEDELIFSIIGRKDVKMTLMEYSVYHGRFVEMLLNQFPGNITTYYITAPFFYKDDNQNIEF